MHKSGLALKKSLIYHSNLAPVKSLCCCRRRPPHAPYFQPPQTLEEGMSPLSPGKSQFESFGTVVCKKFRGKVKA